MEEVRREEEITSLTVKIPNMTEAGHLSKSGSYAVEEMDGVYEKG